MRKIYIICTGGTFGMTATPQGLQVIDNIEEVIRHRIPEFRDPNNPPVGFPKTTFKKMCLIDSSQINCSYWNSIAAEIKNQYDNYDGFIILHGTDTMAYTGAALSFMLEHLSKPVILTGAQIPLTQPNTDARKNITIAIRIAAAYPSIHQVCIYFNRKLFQANRATKVSTKQFQAYRSYTCPAATVSVTVRQEIRISPNDLLQSASTQPPNTLTIHTLSALNIPIIKITPLTEPEHLRQPTNEKAIIFITLGDGNIPIKFYEFIQRAIAQKIVLINRSECADSFTNTTLYAVNTELQELIHDNFISARDQTLETIIAKLTYLFNTGCTQDMIRTRMTESLRGELTINPPPPLLLRASAQTQAEHSSPQSEAPRSVVSRPPTPRAR